MSSKSKTIGLAVISAAATFALNYASLHGVDFQTIGIPSELVKAAIVGHLISFYDWVTPDNLVDAVVQSILWIRESCAKIRGALNRQLQQMRKQ
jgi:hypothetical protein